MPPTWVVTIPPLLVIATVLMTRHMILSFAVGIFSGALITTKGNLFESVLLSLTKLWENSGLKGVNSISSFLGSWNLLTFIFLIFLGILIVMLTKTGAAQAYIDVVRKKVHSKKSVEVASLVLSLFFFIDDYFSALTVGSVMRPLAQLYSVHPLKMAFLTTAMSSPITILVPLSSWIGEIMLQLKQIGISLDSEPIWVKADPYFVLIKTIPYLMYPLILFVSTWYIVLRGISYGPMKKYEKKGALLPSPESFPSSPHSSLWEFLFPLFLLGFTVFTMILYTGNSVLMGGTHSFIEALKHASMHQALFTGGLISVVASGCYFIAKKTLTLRTFARCISEGFNLMAPSLLMLICAWSLGSILKNELQTGSYLATLLSPLITVEFFPVLCFIFAGIVSCMIGSAWATIGLMFPIVTGMLQKFSSMPGTAYLESFPLLLPALGATLSGCIAGTHFSVLSDNPIMSSASTGASHIEHLKTMSWYLIPVTLATTVSFTLMGILPALPAPLVCAVGAASSCILLEMGQKLWSH
ncbi:hypothetical protein H0W26_06295 [Candidatus Dependentiae bacterium]|nr:hypothetical protein [Candidatus Dependentiae bacterium]